MTPEPDASHTVGNIVARDGRAATVFSRHGIDFCCGGRQTLEEAGASKHLDLNSVINELKGSATAAAPDSVDVTGWSVGELVDCIVTRHDTYPRAENDMLFPLAFRLVGDRAEQAS